MFQAESSEPIKKNVTHWPFSKPPPPWPTWYSDSTSNLCGHNEQRQEKHSDSLVKNLVALSLSHKKHGDKESGFAFWYHMLVKYCKLATVESPCSTKWG